MINRIPFTMKPFIAIVCTVAPLLLFSGASAPGKEIAPPSNAATSTGARAATQLADAKAQTHAQNQYGTAVNKLAEAGQPGYGYGWSTGAGQGAGGAGNTLMVLSSQPEAKTEASLREDLAVMAHILDKAAQQSLDEEHRVQTVMGINVLFAPGSHSFRSLYLENYGVLFTLRVGFPLLPPPTEEKAAKEKTPEDSAWDEAKQELYGEHRDARVFAATKAEPYSEEKVDALKEALLDALKNASHIRDLKSEEFVTLCVFGGATGGPAWMGRTVLLGDVPNMSGVTVGRGGAAQRGSVLTIRVRKSDVDAFAKGELKSDQFRTRAVMSTYAGGAGSGDADNPFTVGGGGGFGSSVLFQSDDAVQKR
jgi:hypothetical protein